MSDTPTLAPGSVSRGTMRVEDLLPAFIDAIPDPDRRVRFEDELRRFDFMAGDQQEEMDDLLDTLFEVLNEYVPEGHYFGSHPGASADYGVWPVEAVEDKETSE
jgi:hypothetical protein